MRAKVIFYGCIAFNFAQAILWGQNAPAPEDKAVVHLAPLTVKATYPNIVVRATLSGRNLFDPPNDTVVRAVVIQVGGTDEIDGYEIEVGDELLAINDTDLAGLTLRQISSALTEARRTGLPILRIRRGLAVFDIAYDGDWVPPLPDLGR